MMIHISPMFQKHCRWVGVCAIALSCAFLQSASGQHAVRDDFPNGDKRGVIFEHFTKEEWNASNFAKPEDLKTWRDRRYGMFIHFGITSKALADLSWGSINPRYVPDAPGIMASSRHPVSSFPS
jgi:hypothetical protein